MNGENEKNNIGETLLVIYGWGRASRSCIFRGNMHKSMDLLLGYFLEK